MRNGTVCANATAVPFAMLAVDKTPVLDAFQLYNTFTLGTEHLGPHGTSYIACWAANAAVPPEESVFVTESARAQ